MNDERRQQQMDAAVGHAVEYSFCARVSELFKELCLDMEVAQPGGSAPAQARFDTRFAIAQRARKRTLDQLNETSPESDVDYRERLAALSPGERLDIQAASSGRLDAIGARIRTPRRPDPRAEEKAKAAQADAEANAQRDAEAKAQAERDAAVVRERQEADAAAAKDTAARAPAGPAGAPGGAPVAGQAGTGPAAQPAEIPAGGPVPSGAAPADQPVTGSEAPAEAQRGA